MSRDPLLEIYRWLTEEGASRFHDVLEDVVRIELPSGTLAKIRVIFTDNSFLDIYWSSSGRYSLHYERRHLDDSIYRHDNAPHNKYRNLATFPKRYHDGREENVKESSLPEDLIKAVEEFLKIIHNIILLRQTT